MMQLLKSGITGRELQLLPLSEEQIKGLYNLAQKHKTSPLFCFAANRKNLIGNSSESVFSAEKYIQLQSGTKFLQMNTTEYVRFLTVCNIVGFKS